MKLVNIQLSPVISWGKKEQSDLCAPDKRNLLISYTIETFVSALKTNI